MRTSDLAKYLTDNGVQVTEIVQPDSMTDGHIGLADGRSVQVGRSYASVNRWDEAEEALYIGVLRYNPALVLSDIIKS